MRTKLPRLQRLLSTQRSSGELYPGRTSPTDAILGPLTLAQERIWFLEQLAPGNPVYNLPVAWRLRGPLDVSLVQEAFDELAERYATLRTTFAAVNGTPVQVIAPISTHRLATEDLRLVAKSAQDAKARELVSVQARQPFNLAQGPLWRALLVQLDEEEYILLLTFHRILFDTASVAVLEKELVTHYMALSNGEDVQSILPLEFADYALQQRKWLEGQPAEAQLNYWRRQLDGLSTLQMPTDHARPAVQSYRGARQSRPLSGELLAQLNALSAREGLPLPVVLLTAFQILLHRYTSQDDIGVGWTSTGREQPGTESLLGLFENNLVLRADFSGDPTFQEMLGRLRQVMAEAHANQILPFEKLVEELAPERQMSRTPLFQVLFSMVPARAAFQLGPVEAAPFEFEWGTARHDLSLQFTPGEKDAVCALEYNTDLFDPGTITRLLGHYQVLLEGIAADATKCVAELNLLTEAERRQLLVEWNNTKVDFPKDKCLHELFEAQVGRTPEKVAARYREARLTYRQLNTRANGWANYLVEQGIGPDRLVAILADRSLDFLTAIISVFKAGGAYLPLDPQHPALRIRQILDQSHAQLLIVATEYRPLVEQALEGFTGARPQLVTLETLGRARPRAENLPTRNKPRDLAYVIYTSGSTGAPKGAMVEQVGMINHLYAKIDDLQLTSRDIVAQNASQCFDISVWQFLSGLLVGGQTCILSDDITYDPPQLLNQIQQKNVTLLEIVPSVLRFMVEEIEARGSARPTLAALRRLIPTGEALPPELCRRWLLLYPGIHVVNAYGPTECSDDVTHCFIDRPPALELVNMPVGRPIQNMRMYILDERMQPTPIGVAGELLVGGIGVGRGYLGRPDLTAERFVPNPFAEIKERGRTTDDEGPSPYAHPSSVLRPSSSVLYRTGDLARYLSDGQIEYLGRIDFQVKVRGFRIELAEIEAALAQHPNIRESVVMAREDTSEKRLVAYYVAKQPPAPSGSELRRWLKEKLPEYMVPAAFVALDAMPLTANGKINRKGLPVPPPARPEMDKTFLAPRNALELQLTELWQDVLGVKPIGVQDNFFELGGHSLLAVRLFGEMQRRMGRKLQLASLFHAPTIEQLAVLLQQKMDASPHASLVSIQPDGGKPPLFFVHPIGGDILGYGNLARLLGLDQPFYGLRARGLDGNHQPDERIEDMAAHYIQEILTVEEGGPFFVGGYSFGGIIAFEMARQLTEMGKKVALLAVIDDGPPNYEHSFNWSLSTLGSLIRDVPYWIKDDLLQGTPGMIKNRLSRKLKLVLKRLSNKLDPSDISNFEPDFEDVVDVASIPEYYRSVWKANFEALTRYVPQPYSGKLTLFRVRSQPLFSAHDPRMGWGPYAKDGVQVRMISGFHQRVLVEPHVQSLAQQLDQVLVETHAEHPHLADKYLFFPVEQSVRITAEQG